MCHWFLFLLLLVKSVIGLRMVSLQVPRNAVIGDTLKLLCRYDLEDDTLYSIKWYRDDVEFYRFVPRDRPPGQFFPLPGVNVDIQKSTNGTLILFESDISTTGTYKCEVSADAPSFQTVSAQKLLVVHEFLFSGEGRSHSQHNGLLLFLATLCILLRFLQLTIC